MTTTQSVLDNTNIYAGVATLEDYSPQELSNEHISMSQLLGRDYVFIDVRGNKGHLTNAKQLAAYIEKTAKTLSLSEGRTLFITLHENAACETKFTRHEIHWHQHHAAHIESIHIDEQEQEDFMAMIWQCSTPL